MGQAAGYLKAVGEAAFQCLLVHSRFMIYFLQFTFSFPRYGLGLALGRWFPGVLLERTFLHRSKRGARAQPSRSGLVNVKTRLGGICGTDLGAISVEQFIVRAKTDIKKGD
jgi:hypothetical protein